MPDIKDPNKDANFNKSNIFNKHFVKYLNQSGWQNEEVRSEFVSLVNSIVLSTKGNTTLQKRMLSFLRTALETLNIELKSLSLGKNDEIVNVDAENIEESVKKESCGCSSTNKKESCGCSSTGGVVKNDFGTNIKQLLLGFKKELEEMNVEKPIQDNLIRMTFDISEYTGEDKKILLDKLKWKSEAAIDFIKSNNKLQINEEKEEPEAEVEKGNENKKEKPKPKVKEKEPVKKKQEEPQEKEEENISEKEKDIKVNNFKVFFQNYLVDDVGYTSDDADSIINFVLSHVKKFADNKEGQNKFNRDLSEISNKIKNSFPDVVSDNDQTKNFDIAMNNLSKISVLFNKWSKNSSQKLKDNLLSIASISDKVQIQKSILNQISKITKKYKNGI